jgi:hypothetical protein
MNTIPITGVRRNLKAPIVAQKILLVCGVLSSLLYIAMSTFVAMQYDGYNSASQTISELSAIGAPTRRIWVLLGFVYTLLVAAFGWGILKSANKNRNLRIVGKILILYGIIGIGWPLAPMHQREVLALGGGTFSDTMHIVFSFISVLLMLLAMGFGSRAFGKQFRIYSIATILILVGLGVMTAKDAPTLQANLSTPWLGVWERIMIGVFLLWIVVVAIILLCKEESSIHQR